MNTAEILTKISANASMYAVLQAANSLLASSPEVTTLEVKNYLRSNYPNNEWNQGFISECMDSFAQTGIYTFEVKSGNNFRSYSLANPVSDTMLSSSLTIAPTSTTLDSSTSVKVKPDVKTVKESLTNIVKHVKGSNGKFITVTFTKKTDNSKRVMNCIFTGVTELGHLSVKATGSKNGGAKQIDPHTIISVKMNNTLYVVK